MIRVPTFAGGTAFAACVASILEVTPGELPDLSKVHPDDVQAAVNDFARPKSLAYIEISLDEYPNAEWAALDRLGYFILRGPRFDGVEHAAVFLGSNVVHDPVFLGAHPGETFAVNRMGTWGVGIFVPFNPLFVRRHDRR